MDFDDARLEAEFRAEFATVAQKRHFPRWGGTALMHAMLALTDVLVIPPDRVRACLLVRFGGMIPFTLLVGCFARVPPAIYARWGERVVSLGRVGVFALCAVLALVVAPLRWPTTQYLVTLVALLVVIQHS